MSHRYHGPCGPLVATPRGHVMHYVDEGAGEPLLRFWEAPVESLDPGSWILAFAGASGEGSWRITQQPPSGE